MSNGDPLASITACTLNPSRTALIAGKTRHVRRHPGHDEVLPSGLLDGGDEVRVVPRIDDPGPLHTGGEGVGQDLLQLG